MWGEISNFILNYLNILLISMVSLCIYGLKQQYNRKQVSSSSEAKQLMFSLQCLPDDFANALIEAKSRRCWEQGLANAS